MGCWLSSCSFSSIPSPTSPVTLSTRSKLKADVDYLLLNSEWVVDDFVVSNSPFNSSGAFAIVAKGHSKVSDSQCVLKLIRQFYGDKKQICGRVTRNDFFREMEIMTYIQKHILRNQFYSSRSFENLIQCSMYQDYWDVSDNQKSLCAEGVIVVEHLLGGSLDSFVSEYKSKDNHLGEEHLRQIFLPVFHAVKVLHDHRIVHNEINLKNLVFRDIEHRQLVLIDFGLAYQLRWPNEPQIVMPTCSTDFLEAANTFSPTIVDSVNQNRGVHISPRNDVFSLGKLLEIIMEECGQVVMEYRRKSNHIGTLIAKMKDINGYPNFTIDDAIHTEWFTCSRDALLPPEYPQTSNSCDPSLQNFFDRILKFKRKTDTKKEQILDSLAAFLKKELWQTVNGKYIMNSIDNVKFSEYLHDESVGLEMFRSLVNVTVSKPDGPSTIPNLNGGTRISYQEILLLLRSLEMFTMEQLVDFEIKLLTVEGKDKISPAVLLAALDIDYSEEMNPGDISNPTTTGDNEDGLLQSSFGGLSSPHFSDSGLGLAPTATGPESLILRQFSGESKVSDIDIKILTEAFEKDGLAPDQLSALCLQQAQQTSGCDDNKAISSIIAPLFSRMYSDAPLDQQLALQRGGNQAWHADEEYGNAFKDMVKAFTEMAQPITLSSTENLKSDLAYITHHRGWSIVDFVVPNDPMNSSGRYGIVTLGNKEPQHDGPKHVLKIIRPFYKASSGSADIGGVMSEKDFMREYEIMKYINQHIVSRQHYSSRALLRVVDHWIHRTYPHNEAQYVEGVFVVERLEGKDFRRFLDDGECISEVNLRILLLPVFKALKVLHTHRIVHNDMRLENLVFRDKTHSELVIVDFGLAYQLRWPDEVQISIPTFGVNDGSSSQRQDELIVPRNDIRNMGLTLDRILDKCGQVDASNQIFKSLAVQELITMMTTSPYVTIDDVLSSKWILCDSLELAPPSHDAPCVSLSTPASLSQASFQRVKFSFQVHQQKQKFKKFLEHSDLIKADEVLNIAKKISSEMTCRNSKLVMADTAFTTCLSEVNCFRPFISVMSEQEADFNNDYHIDCQEILLFLRIIGIFSTLQLHRLMTEILSFAKANQFNCVNSTKSASDLSYELLNEVDQLLYGNSWGKPIMSLCSQFSPRTRPVTPFSASCNQSNRTFSAEKDEGAASGIDRMVLASVSDGRDSPCLELSASNVANHEQASTNRKLVNPTIAEDVPTAALEAAERINANEAAAPTEETGLLT